MRFADFQLSDDVQLAVRALGFEDPTPIQERAIPIVLDGKDVVGSAQTGTGKTAAFVLPILTRLIETGKFRVLIIEPTRELALQVEAAIHQFSRFSPIRASVMYGGVGYGRQTDLCRKGVDIWVATPGRVLDHIEKKTLNLKDVQIVVLDEADRLLDMGFIPDIRKLLGYCPKERQTLLFSATMPPEIESLCSWALKDPERIQIDVRQSTAETVNHSLYPVAEAQKMDLLHELLERTHYESVIVFCRMKSRADMVAGNLRSEGHSVAVLHADRNQAEREEALAGFRNGKYEVLVATDIASRGLDIATVTHVINFDVPQHPEDYVHRIGRTGRAKSEGDALTLFTAEDATHVVAIEKFIGKPIDRVKLENFNYIYTQLFALKPGEDLQKIKVSGGRAGKGYSFSSAKRKR